MMWHQIQMRLMRGLFTLFAAVTIVFFAIRLNVNVAELQGNLAVSPEALDAFDQRWGLNKSLGEQYVAFVRSLIAFDLGVSFRDGRPAHDWIVERLPQTLMLGGAGFFLAVTTGISLGLVAASHKGRRLDRIIMFASAVSHGTPSFVVGIVLISVFALYFPLLPSGGGGSFWHLVLPAATYCISGTAGVIRHTRASMIAELGRDYVRGARSTGASDVHVTLGYALRNALPSVLTVVGLSAGSIIGHGIVLETVFSWPGLGSALVKAVVHRDLAVVQAIVLLFVSFMIVVNIIVDILCLYLNPKLRSRA